MRISVDLSQVSSLAVAIGNAGPRARALGAAAVQRTALGIERDAKVLAPVDTGNLRSSVSVTFSRGGMTAEIGPTAEYGIYQEFGTSTQPPQAFLGPASDRHITLLDQAVARIPEEFF